MAIKKHQSLMYEVIENMKSMVRVMDDNDMIIYMNKKMRDEFGDLTGQKCYTLLCSDDKCDLCISKKSRESKDDQYKDIAYGDKQYRIIASPAFISDGEVYSIEIFQDITDQKQLEQQFHNHYEKLKGDIGFAKQIQRKALPVNGNYWNALKVSSAYLPSEDLSGDLFDIVRIDEDLCLFYIADVSGHGVRSSLLTIFIRQAIRGLRSAAADPAVLLEELIKSYHDLNLDKEQYISILCGIYNRRTRALDMLNAGHNCMPLIIEYDRKEEPIIREITLKGMPICNLLSSSNHQIKTMQMEQGDRILLYTDGISEAYNENTKDEFGIEGIKKTIRECSDREDQILVDRIIHKAVDYATTKRQDDMAVIMFQIL